MRRRSPETLVMVGTLTAASIAAADTIVQTGEIETLGEVEIVLAQFDDEGGARELNFVQIDVFSRMRGGFTTSGNGVPVRVAATFSQDYFLGDRELAGTLCLFRDRLENDVEGSFSFLVSDSDQSVISQQRRLEPWIGPDQITLTSVGDLVWDIDPPEGLRDFGATPFAEYTVTYDFTVRDCDADLDEDGVIGVRDLLAVIAAWGNQGGPEDINGDGVVNVLDLLEVVASWGPCP